MRYWFNEATNEAYALAEPPPDGADTMEIDEDFFNEIRAAVAAAGVPVAEPEPTPLMKRNGDGEAYGTPAPPATTNMEQLARVWRKMQDARDANKKVYEIADKRIEDDQKMVSAALLKAMNEMGGTALKTAAGVIEKKEQIKASGADWQAVYRFIVANDAWELLHKRIGTQFVEEWRKKTGDYPPGINVFTEYKINVKKPGSTDLPKEEN
jgi:hypothetical protein